MERLDTAMREIETDTESTKRMTLRFMESVVPKLVGQAHLNQKPGDGGCALPLLREELHVHMG